jgi:hypothetical protein
VDALAALGLLEGGGTPAFVHPLVRAAVYAAMVLAMFGLRTDERVPFIYFQF